jgi:hypothetical protein
MAKIEPAKLSTCTPNSSKRVYLGINRCNMLKSAGHIIGINLMVVCISAIRR